MKYIQSCAIIALFVSALPAFAQMGMMQGSGYNYVTPDFGPQVVGGTELEAALKTIYESQGIMSREDIDCNAVSEEQFEVLGDAYMHIMHPDETQHVVMDQMMGGEGSESLRLAHINMGRSYLGCWSDYEGAPLHMPMMGGFGMGGMYPMYGYAMMGSGGWYDDQYQKRESAPWYEGNMWHGGYSNVVTTILLWGLLLLGIVALLRWLKLNR